MLVVTDEEVATELAIEPGKFYVYFTPSILNGFENLVDKPLNLHHIQALEGIA